MQFNGPLEPIDDFLARGAAPKLVTLGQGDVPLIPVLSRFLDEMTVVTFLRTADHVAGAARQCDVSFRAVLTLTGQALALAAMLGVVIVLLEAPLAKVHCRKKAGNVGNSVKVAKSFVVHQVQIEDGPVLVLVVGDQDKFVAQRRRHDRHPNL